MRRWTSEARERYTRDPFWPCVIVSALVYLWVAYVTFGPEIGL